MEWCAGYGGEVENSDFYGKRSKLCLDFYGKRSKIGLIIYGKRSKFERRDIKKHRGDGPRCFFVGMWCCAEEMVRRREGCRCAAGG